MPGKPADRADYEPFFNRRDLRFDAAAHIQASSTPILQDQIHVLELGGNRDDEQIFCMTAVADDDRWADLAARQVSEGNREKDNLISGEAH